MQTPSSKHLVQQKKTHHCSDPDATVEPSIKSFEDRERRSVDANVHTAPSNIRVLVAQQRQRSRSGESRAFSRRERPGQKRYTGYARKRTEAVKEI